MTTMVPAAVKIQTARAITRIGAGIDCANGHAAEGVAAMEGLLKRKGFEVPPTTGVAQSPR
jgi:hypothetical protein